MNDESDRTSKEYIRRINLVLDFIEKNLDKELSLGRLAQRAHYSPYHFHRLFSTIIGESLNQYINRKRLERIASILLTESKKSLRELAYNYGFSNESSLSRSFKKYYGISPSRFRSEGKTALSKIGIESFSAERYICSIDQINKWIRMNAQIVITELQEIELAAITRIGEFGKMENLFQKLMKWGDKNEVLDTLKFKAITIYHDNPNVTHHSKVRYSAGVTISKNIEADGEIRPHTIPKGIYVVARFEISGPDISKAWKNTCIWVIENGYKFRDGEYFEIYHNDHKTHPQQKIIIDKLISNLTKRVM